MIVGVDLGTRRVALACPETGWYYRDDLQNAAGKRHYPLEVDAGRALGARVRSAVFSAISGGQLPVLGLEFWYERPVVQHGRHANVGTAVGQGLSAGALLAQLPGSFHQIRAASTWKKELIGNGNAKPADYIRWVQDHHPSIAAVCGQDEDLFAANCIALWAAVAPRGEL